MTAHQVSRRLFLSTGGALVVGFAISPAFAQGQPQKPAQNINVEPNAGPPLPGSLGKAPYLDAWIAIDAKNGITVFTGKVELGQGIKTALIQCAAEQLNVDFGAIKLVTADTERTPNEGYTAGSHSMQDSGTAILNAAAQVRAILIDLAAARFNAPADQLKAQGGKITAPDGSSVSYGELVTGQELHRMAQPTSPLKDPKDFTVMGKPVQRIDIPGKVSGGAMYVQDVRMHGMLHARVVRPPGYAAQLADVDTAQVQKMPGVVNVIRNGSFLAVVAQGEFQAIEAMNALSAAAQWRQTAQLPDQNDIHTHLESLPTQNQTIDERGSPDEQGARVLKARYSRPYLSHGSIGPSCAVALYHGGKLTVWTHSQGVYPLRNTIANMLHMPQGAVRCIHSEGAGCYGQNGADDVAADVAIIAHAMPGKPIRLQWMREQEHGWEPFGPAQSSNISAALDGSGKIVAWKYEVWSNTHSTRPEGPPGVLIPARYLAQPFEPLPPKPLPMPEGGGDRNAIPLYTIPNSRVVYHFIPEMPIRVSALRSLGAPMNIFAIESFMDELADAANADPVEFRLKHLDDPRARDVISKAAEEFGWNKGAKLPRGQGHGFAFARYKNLAAYCAVAMEISVEHETGAVKIGRVVAAVDSGQVVNPDGIRNQVEGAIVQSASWALYEQVTFDRKTITSRDWSSYPMIRFSFVPESIDVHIIDRPGEKFLGTGECGQAPTQAAIANGIARATGVRLREMPLTSAKIKQAIGV
jgi:CO/xanthine dehydrogenase Mo-binding subunit